MVEKITDTWISTPKKLFSATAREALLRAARWYVEHGFVKPARVERIRRAGRLAS